MSQPQKFTRNFNFADFQSSNPTTPLPAAQVESELNEIKASTDAIIDNLALIQRDDGALANASVHVASLSTAVKNLMLLSSVNIRGDWSPATAYAVGDVVVSNGTPYVCHIAHTSGVSIDTSKFASLTAPLETPGDPDDDNKFLRASGGVGIWTAFTASMITDIVAGLQAVITAADVGAARTALGVTATGDSLVTAASAAAARTALGATTIGSTIFAAADEAAVIAALAVPTLAAANAFTANQEIQLSDNGAGEGPTLLLYRNSASPADNDLLGAILFNGRSDLPTERTMAKILSQVLDVSNATEDATLAFQTVLAGSLATRGYFGGGLVVGTPTGGDQGVGAINAESVLINGSPISGGGGAWQEIDSGAISGAALDIVFTPASWRAIQVVLTNLIPQTDDTELYVRLDDNGGASFQAGTEYSYVGRRNRSDDGSASNVFANDTAQLRITTMGTGTSEELSVKFTLLDPNAGGVTHMMWRAISTWTGGNYFSVDGGGAAEGITGPINAIRFLASSGNLSGGKYKVLGLTE